LAHNTFVLDRKIERRNRKFVILDEKKTKFTILDTIFTKTRNLYKILDEIGDFGRKKNDILDKIFLVSLNMPVAQYKISVDIIKSTLNFSVKQVYHNIESDMLHYFLQTRKSVHICPFAN